jgi:hypothetical protein
MADPKQPSRPEALLFAFWIVRQVFVTNCRLLRQEPDEEEDEEEDEGDGKEDDDNDDNDDDGYSVRVTLFVSVGEG